MDAGIGLFHGNDNRHDWHRDAQPVAKSGCVSGELPRKLPAARASFRSAQLPAQSCDPPGAASAVTSFSADRAKNLGLLRAPHLLGRFDSQSFLPAGRRDLPERPAVAFERGFFAAQGLPTGNYYVGVLRIEFEAIAHALRQLRGGQRRAAAEERVIDQFPATQMVKDRVRRMSSTGFCVGWSNLSSSLEPIMNFGDGDDQIVEFSLQPCHTTEH